MLTRDGAWGQSRVTRTLGGAPPESDDPPTSERTRQPPGEVGPQGRRVGQWRRTRRWWKRRFRHKRGDWGLPGRGRPRGVVPAYTGRPWAGEQPHIGGSEEAEGDAMDGNGSNARTHQCVWWRELGGWASRFRWWPPCPEQPGRRAVGAPPLGRPCRRQRGLHLCSICRGTDNQETICSTITLLGIIILLFDVFSKDARELWFDVFSECIKKK